MKKEIGKILFEYEATHTVSSAPTIASTHQQPDISLDAKVDHFLIEYEKSSQPQPQLPAKTQNESFVKQFVGFLFEADDPMADLGGDDAGGGDLGDLGGGGMPDFGGGGEGGEVDPRDQVPTPKINIQTMASNVARLVKNFEQLVAPSNTVLNRAHAFMLKNYNETVAREFMIILERNFGLSTRSKQQQKYEGAAAIGPGAAVGDLSGATSTGAES